MTNEHTLTNRRTVLRNTATVLAGAVVAATPVSATSFLPGDCVRLTIDVQAFTEACPNGGLGPYIDAGEEGTVWATCTTDDGHDMVLFRHTGDRTDTHWVSEQFFEHC